MLNFLPFELEDRDFLFQIRNDQSVRKASVMTDEITLSMHTEWLSNFLADGRQYGWIVHLPDVAPIGYLRAEIVNLQPGCALVSLALLPDYRKQGYGSEAIEFLHAWAQEIKLSYIRAHVRKENVASYRLFVKKYHYTVEERETFFVLHQFISPKER